MEIIQRMKLTEDMLKELKIDIEKIKVKEDKKNG